MDKPFREGLSVSQIWNTSLEYHLCLMIFGFNPHYKQLNGNGKVTLGLGILDIFYHITDLAPLPDSVRRNKDYG